MVRDVNGTDVINKSDFQTTVPRNEMPMILGFYQRLRWRAGLWNFFIIVPLFLFTVCGSLDVDMDGFGSRNMVLFD